MENNIVRPKILIVDDISENLFVLEKILSKSDAHLIRASSGNEALSLVLDHEFALIILDVQMPDMDGYEVAEILKSNERTENIPIIFVTAINRDEAKEIRGYGTGAVDFIFKPLNKFILLSKVNVFLELHRIKNGLEQLVEERTAELKESNRELKEQIIKNIEANIETEKARAYLRKVVNSISSSLISVDSAGRVTDMNSHSESLAGLSSEEAQGKLVSEVFPFYNMLARNIEQSADSEAVVEKSRIPVYIRGRLVINNFAFYPFSFNNDKGVVIRIDDVTEKVRMDEIVIQSEKMLSMGGIAAGMAHEINNPLAGIIQNIQVIRNRIQGDLPANHEAAGTCGITMDAIRKYMEIREVFRMMDSVHKSGNRAAQIVEDMLTFSRKNEGTLKHENLADLMEKAIKLAVADYKTKSEDDIDAVEIVRNYQEEMPLVSCQPGKIQQVMMNILKNAFQAMAGNEENKIRRLTVSISLSDPDMVSVEIADTGEGMDDSVCKKIFEPFFSTRKSGTGLGLSISYFIITEDHKGKLDVSSFPGEGSTFTIKLPLHKSIPA